MEPNGLVRDTVGAKIIPIDTDKTRNNAEPGEANPLGFGHVGNASEPQLRLANSGAEGHVSLHAAYAVL